MHVLVHHQLYPTKIKIGQNVVTWQMIVLLPRVGDSKWEILFEILAATHPAARQDSGLTKALAMIVRTIFLVVGNYFLTYWQGSL